MTWRKPASYILGAAATVLGLYGGIVLRFQNPDMTNTRLLIEFWPYYVAILVLVFAFVLVRGNK